MAQTLPDGLVQVNKPFKPSVGDLQPVPVLDMIQLWKAYSSVKHALRGQTGVRLEQFFWRIIGSPRLQKSLSGAKVAYLHALIYQDNPLRTTPRASPSQMIVNKRESVSFDSDLININQGSMDSPNDRLNKNEGSRLKTSNAQEQKGRDRSTSRPRPILRMPGVDTTAPGKSARILTPTWGQNAKAKSTAKGEGNNNRESSLKTQFQDLPNREVPNLILKPQKSPTISQGSEASPTSQSTSSSSKSGKRAGSFAVNSKKRRPAVLRRKSSQSTSGITVKSPKSTASPTKRITTPSNSTRSQSYGQEKIHETGDLKPIRENENTSKSLPITTGSSSKSQIGAEGESKLGGIPSLLLHPRLRNLSAKSTLATGVTLNSPIVASLQPFGDGDCSPKVRLQPLSGNANSSIGKEEEEDNDTLPRSRSNLSLLLQKDKRRASEDIKYRRG